MLQDLAFGRLENEYTPVPPQDSDAVLCFRDNAVLLRQLDNDALVLPTVGQWRGREEDLQYAFRLHGRNFFLWLGREGECSSEEFDFIPVRQLRQSFSWTVCYAVMTG